MNEIERKYIARLDNCRMEPPDESMYIKQGYIIVTKWFEWRVRRLDVLKRASYHDYEPATMALKIGNGFVRKEYEREIPLWLFNVLAKFVPRWLRKARYGYRLNGGEWSIDRFYGDLQPLVLAEFEAPADVWKYYDSTPPPPRGVELLRDVTEARTYNNKWLGRLTPDEAKELIIDDVADLGVDPAFAKCSVYSGVESAEQQQPVVQRSGIDVQQRDLVREPVFRCGGGDAVEGSEFDCGWVVLPDDNDSEQRGDALVVDAKVGET